MAVPSSRIELAGRVRGIDHVTIGTRDHRAARRFYELALRPLGYSIALDWTDGGRTYFGVPGEASSLWLVEGSNRGQSALSLAAPDRSAVYAFYAAALAAGGQPLAPPGFRPEYTPYTYAAEALDPDGNSIEAVCRYAEPLTETARYASRGRLSG
jgi:catechol 2,3-dioxygenase-like lactoylglutathione lyase family enzyme